MASKKDGSACSIIAPIAPAEAKYPLNETPGAASAASAAAKVPTKYTFTKIKAPEFKPLSHEEAEQKQVKLSWIEIELLDKAGAPVAGAYYEICMKDDTVASGTLDEKGRARVEGIEEGTCGVSFPQYAPSSWKKK
jgi:hypothetical protein